MLSPSWKCQLLSRLAKNIELQGPVSAYVSLATIGQDGPSNRTVVVRGFAGEHYEEELGWESDLLVITCDKRSAKVQELEREPSCEISWWMGGTQEQWRLHGRMLQLHSKSSSDIATVLQPHVARKSSGVMVAPKRLANQAFVRRQGKQEAFDWQAERLRQWYLLADPLRATFCDPTTEPLGIDGMDDRGHFMSKKHQDLLERGYDNFVVLLFKTAWVDHLTLETGEHLRWSV